MFALTDQAINVQALREQLTQNERCGAFNSFEGWVRRHNDGKTVDYLVYTAYAQLAQSQGEAIIAQAKQRFAIEDAVCVHRVGKLAIGEITAMPPLPPAALLSTPLKPKCRFGNKSFTPTAARSSCPRG